MGVTEFTIAKTKLRDTSTQIGRQCRRSSEKYQLNIGIARTVFLSAVKCCLDQSLCLLVTLVKGSISHIKNAVVTFCFYNSITLPERIVLNF